MDARCSLGVKVKVELPGAILGDLTVLVDKSDPELDKLEDIDITAHRLVVIVRRRFELANWARYDGWKLAILRRIKRV